MNFRYIAILLITMVSNSLCGQSFPDQIFGKEFAAQVKSIDEFIQRFNGVEKHPEILNDEGRRLNLLALFDFQKFFDNASDSLTNRLIEDFVLHVENTNTNIRLTDSEMYAEVEVTATISSKKVEIALILQSQTYHKDRIRWAFVGAKGIKSSKIIDFDHFYGISPVDHETHFMSLSDIIENNNSEIFGYRGKDAEIDELSVFFSFVMLGIVHDLSVNNITIHCLDVPSYIFTINEEGRRGSNSGWLITSVSEVKDTHKKEYKSKILGL